MVTPKTPPYESKNIKVSDLLLDKTNPRFVEMFGANPAEDDLIRYMLNHEKAYEIADSILDLGYFHIDEALWVFSSEGGKYVVREGNRRLSAVKALADPEKFFGNKKNQLKLDELPCLIYTDENALDERIRQRHTSAIIRRWSRLAKAKYAKIMFDKGEKDQSSDLLKLLKLSSVYSAAQNIGMGKKLYDFLESDQKSAILERFFGPKELLKKYCGFYLSKNEVEILDENSFKRFLSALIKYTNHNNLTAKDISSNKKEEYLSEKFGLTPSNSDSEDSSPDNGNTENSEPQAGSHIDTPAIPVKPQAKTLGAVPLVSKRGSVQTYPHPKRKQLPPNIKKIIDELYKLDGKTSPNAKYAFIRVVFENVLKYVVENTRYCDASGKDIFLIDSRPLKDAKPNEKHPYTNFTLLKTNFTAIVKNKGIKNALNKFDMDGMNQVIHNYNSKISDRDAKKECDNLIPIIEFLLREEADLIAELDTSKL